MALVPRTTIDHFPHEGHSLIKLHAETEYLCHRCKTFGDGARYRCNSCDFVLHKYCDTCPAILSSFMHSHSLNLVAPNPQNTGTRICNVCDEKVLGISYRCENCDFDVHPLCTQLQQHVNHELHQLHPLQLQEPFFGCSCCAVCGGACSTCWSYRCGPCGFALHLECVLARLPPPQPQPQHPPPEHRAVQNSRGLLPPLELSPPNGGYDYGMMYPYVNQGYGYRGHGYGITYPYMNWGGQGGGAIRRGKGKMIFRLVTKLAFGALPTVLPTVIGLL